MSRRDHRALQSYLVILMQHIIKWHSQPHLRSKSWCSSIANSRRRIAVLRGNMPSLTESVVLSYWEQSLHIATKQAEDEMQISSVVQHLSWQEVFEEEYSLPF